MEKYLTKALILLFFLPLLTNCSSNKNGTSVTFEDKDSLIFTISEMDADDLTASNNTMIKAIKVCGGDRQDVILLDYSVKYMGYSKEQKKLITAANKTFHETSKTTTPYDYKATLKFKCHWPVKKKDAEDAAQTGVK